MAGIGAPKGNQYAAKDKLFRNAILNCLDKHPEGRMAAMMEIAQPLIEAAKKGDVQASREIVDRLDGKAAQSLMVAGDPDNDAPIRSKLTIELVNPASG